VTLLRREALRTPHRYSLGSPAQHRIRPELVIVPSAVIMPKTRVRPKGTIEREKALGGLFITLAEPTREMEK
jgi:hypothetical protein